MERASRGESRIPVIDVVRLMSLLVVFAVHLQGLYYSLGRTAESISRAWTRFARNGTYGVTLFFVVSGLVITRTILERSPTPGEVDLRGFYVRRAARILPLLLLHVAVGLALLAWGAGRAGYGFCLKDPAAAFDGAFWLSIPTLSFNWLRILRESHAQGWGLHWDILWSLAIEEQFYLFYPLLMRAAKTTRRLAFILGAFCALGPAARLAALWLRPTSFLAPMTNSFGAFEQLSLGALLYLLLRKTGKAPLPGVPAGVEAKLGVLGGMGVIFVYRFTVLGEPVDRFYGPTAIALALALFLFVGIRREWFGGLKALAAPGRLSYGGYLLHPAVLFLLWPVLSRIGFSAGMALYAAATLSAAFLIHRFYEAPANRAARRSFNAG